MNRAAAMTAVFCLVVWCVYAASGWASFCPFGDLENGGPVIFAQEELDYPDDENYDDNETYSMGSTGGFLLVAQAFDNETDYDPEDDYEYGEYGEEDAE